MGNFFYEAAIAKKKAIVFDHYERSYQKEMKKRGLNIVSILNTFTDSQIEEYYKKIIILNEAEHYYKNRPKLDPRFQHVRPVQNSFTSS